MTNPLRTLQEYGQSVWLDFLSRDLLRGGELKRLIADDGLRGMTSNPSIFEKAIGHGKDYDAQIAELEASGDLDPGTLFERLAYDPSTDRSVVRCRPVTGRRHQIRVHLAARGWPVVGDAVYGDALEGFPRHALHAWRLGFRHPVTGARVDLSPTRVVDLSTHIGDAWPYQS